MTGGEGVTVDRVLAGLPERMLDPDLVEVFIAEYREEHAKRAAQLRWERGAAERRLANATATIDRLVAAVASGGVHLSSSATRSTKRRTTVKRR